MRSSLIVTLFLAIAIPASGQVVINEFNCGTPDFVELRNLSLTTSVDVSGWVVESYQSSGGTPTFEGSYTLPSGTVIAPRGEFVLHENGTAGAASTTFSCGVRTGYNYNWTSSRNVIVILRDGGTAQDYVYRNNSGGASGAPSLPGGLTWTGSFTSSGNACSRLTDADTDDGSDWTTASNATPCADNPGQMATPPPPPPVDLQVTTTGMGDFSASIATTPAIPNGEYWNLVSFDIQNPVGSGALFGVGLDVLPQIAGPTGTLFHNFLNGSGTWSFSAGPGSIQQGLHVQIVTVVVDLANNAVVASDVADVQF